MSSNYRDGSIHDALRISTLDLKDQAVAVLREAIIAGRFPQGSKLVERDVARLLGTSRAPARDALLALEREGLVVARGYARHVVELRERDIHDLYVVRRTLEPLAVRLASQNQDEAIATQLYKVLDETQIAIDKNDTRIYKMCDLETHRLLWKLAKNHYLLKQLESLAGPIFMFINLTADGFHDWDDVLMDHREMVEKTLRGETEAAVEAIQRHIDNRFGHLLRPFGAQSA
jgi:DNA-binding GntR family transcriptional regulator